MRGYIELVLDFLTSLPVAWSFICHKDTPSTDQVGPLIQVSTLEMDSFINFLQIKILTSNLISLLAYVLVELDAYEP